MATECKSSKYLEVELKASIISAWLLSDRDDIKSLSLHKVLQRQHKCSSTYGAVEVISAHYCYSIIPENSSLNSQALQRIAAPKIQRKCSLF